MIHHGDCLDVMPTLDAESVDAIVTDPPYGLEFMGKEWDKLGWQGGGGFSKPGIGDRPTAWASYSSTSRFGAANPTCAACGGRARGAKRCTCPEPQWKPIGKRRNPENEGLPDDVTGAGMSRQMRGMQEWHHRWAVEAFRVAKPGAHLLAFGGTRTYHRLASAIEDAGWEVRDCLVWAYASGFPKSLDVSKAIDKAAGAQREVVGQKHVTNAAQGKGLGHGDLVSGTVVAGLIDVTAPATPEAAKWQGWGTALKPAWEPIILARKPLRGTVARNVQEYGTGALNIDGCRIDHNGNIANAGGGGHGAGYEAHNVPGRKYGNGLGGIVAEPHPAGRWPANIVLTDPIFDGGWDGVVGGGETQSAWGKTSRGVGDSRIYGSGEGYRVAVTGQETDYYGDSGTYSRFFELPRGEGCYLCGRAKPADESSDPPSASGGSAPSPALIEASSDATTTTDSPATSGTATPFWSDDGASTPSIPRGKRRATSPASAPLSSRAKSMDADGQATGTTTTTPDRWTCDICAALITSPITFEPGDTRFLIIPKAARADREPVFGGGESPDRDLPLVGLGAKFCALCGEAWINPDGWPRCGHGRENTKRRPPLNPKPRANRHPTVKPTDLMRHLVRLVTPPGGTVLDPFLGSGTTALAAEMEGFAWVGIEREEEYVRIAEARLNGTQKGMAL